MKRACQIDLQVLLESDLMLINKGALAEQFVGQELLALDHYNEPNHLFTWAREEKSSSAEIDFLTSIGSHVVLIEVKAGAIGSLRSLKIFLSEKEIPLGVRISENPLSLRENILPIPFYLIEQLPRLYEISR